MPEEYSFPDNWIYVHSKDVKVGRIQNFGSWSPYLVKEGRTCLGLEFFVFEGDETWNKSDEDLIEQGKRELGILGLVDPAKVEAGYVVRMPKAYPFYDAALQGERRPHRRVARGLRAERAPRRPQRHAPLQQPGPLDVHGDAHGREHRHRLAPRRLERERRGGVPRGVGRHLRTARRRAHEARAAMRR